MKLTLLSLLTMILLNACAPGDGSEEEQMGKIENPVLNDSLSGVYSAIIPCDNCPGRQFFLALRPDYEYETVEKVINDPNATVSKYGSWYLRADSVLVLTHHDPGRSLYALDDRKLWMLDVEGNRREGPKEKQYALIRINNEPPPSKHAMLYSAKLARGIDFYGHGYTPAYWNIDIDSEGWTKLKADTLSLITPSPKPVESHDPNIEGLAIETSLGMLTMQIVNKPCIDAQTGKEYDYTVSVQLGMNNYEGCGNWIMENKMITSDTMQ